MLTRCSANKINFYSICASLIHAMEGLPIEHEWNFGYCPWRNSLMITCIGSLPSLFFSSVNWTVWTVMVGNTAVHTAKIIFRMNSCVIDGGKKQGKGLEYWLNCAGSCQRNPRILSPEFSYSREKWIFNLFQWLSLRFYWHPNLFLNRYTQPGSKRRK